MGKIIDLLEKVGIISSARADDEVITTYYKNYNSTDEGHALVNGITISDPMNLYDDVTGDEFAPREGYDFVEWNTERDGTGTSYEIDAFISTSGLVLYAIWTGEEPGPGPGPEPTRKEVFTFTDSEGDTVYFKDSAARSSVALLNSKIGNANGIASLDSAGKVPASQLPSYVDDVLEYASQSSFPAAGEVGKIYVATDTNKSYRWSGSTYIELSVYALVTQAASGLMSAADKKKLDGVATGATANVGTITGIKMNGSSKGTSGVVDLGTVLTSHQDISGKVSGPSSATNNAVAIFDGTDGKAIKNSGYTIGKSVPSDAKFTDTTYSAATTSAAGLMSADDKTKLNGISAGAQVNPGNATTSAAGLMSADDKTKLDGIATGATANTGTITGIIMNGASKGTSGVVDLGTVITAHQNISGKADKSATVSTVSYDSTNKKLTKTINGTTSDVVTVATLKTAMSLAKGDVGLGSVENKSSATIRGEITSSNVTTALGFTPMNSNLKGANNGVAELDSTGKVPASQLPSYVDDVLEYDKQSSFPATGETGKIYIAKDTNKTYRWSGTAYVEISASLALGETSSTAYRGDRGKTAYDHASAKGSAFASGLYKITTNSEGHVTAATVVAKSDITALGIPGSDTNTHRPIQVNGTEILGNNTTALNLKAGSNVSVTNSSGTVTIAATDTTYSAATTSAAGLMSAADKTKLDGVATGATANVGTITGIKMNGSSKGTSGVVDLGTVITAHQDISGKVSGPSSATNNAVAIFDGAGGKIIKNSGFTIGTSVPSDAVFTDHLYTAGVGLSLSGSKFAVKLGYESAGKNYRVQADESGDLYVVVPWENTTYPVATTSVTGLMSATDKSKLDGINSNLINLQVYDINSLSTLTTTLNSIVSSLADHERRMFVLNFSTNVSIFKGGQYNVDLTRTQSKYSSGIAYTYNTDHGIVQLQCNNNTWTFVDQIGTIKVAQDLGTFATIDAIQSAITAEMGSMSNYEIRHKSMTVSAATGVFVNTAYVIEITKFSSSRCFVKAYRGNSTNVNYGNLANSSWAWV